MPVCNASHAPEINGNAHERIRYGIDMFVTFLCMVAQRIRSSYVQNNLFHCTN